MAKAPSLNIPITFSVEFVGHPDVLESTYQMHYLGSGPEVINELRSNAAHCLAIADRIERDAEEKKTAEAEQLAELLHTHSGHFAGLCGFCVEMARKLIARGVKVGK